MDIIRKYQAEEDEKTIGMLKASGGTRCGIYPMRSSCEIPLNAKVENIKAMMDSVK